MKSYQQLFAELKRRRVFRVAAIYGATSFVILQAAELVLPRLGLPDWTVTFMVAILILAFPVALILAWAFEVTPEGVRRTQEAGEDELRAIVAEPPSKRWPSGLLALLGVVALLGSGWWIGRRTAPEGETQAGVEVDAPSPEMRLVLADTEDDSRPSIAVLPFADMSPQRDQDYFSDGITDELLNTLAKVRELRVTARTSTFALKNRQMDARDIGDSLGVGYIVEGSVRKDGDKLRITAQLIDATDGSHLWSDQYDRALNDVFAIQTEIAEAIAEALRVPLGLEEGEQLVSPTDDLEAYDLYLAGRARMRERGESIWQAIDLFEAAIARDSAWAPAWAGLAESRALIPYYPEAPADSVLWANSLAAAERAANRALELDPRNASALVALGNVYRDRWQWREAEATYTRALTLDPDNVEAHQQYAEYLMYVGRNAEAYTASRRALALDRSPIRLQVAGATSAMNGRYDEAAALFAEGIRLDPEERVPALRRSLRTIELYLGNWSAWRDQILTRYDTMDVDVAARLRAAWPPNAGPPPAEALAIDSVWSRVSAAVVWLARDDRERAVRALERDPAGWIPFGNSGRLFTPSLDPLRDDPRFEAVLANRGLAGRRPLRISDASGS